MGFPTHLAAAGHDAQRAARSDGRSWPTPEAVPGRPGDVIVELEPGRWAVRSSSNPRTDGPQPGATPSKSLGRAMLVVAAVGLVLIGVVVGRATLRTLPGATRHTLPGLRVVVIARNSVPPRVGVVRVVVHAAQPPPIFSPRKALDAIVLRRRIHDSGGVAGVRAGADVVAALSRGNRGVVAARPRVMAGQQRFDSAGSQV